jgi:hypothetical protein
MRLGEFLQHGRLWDKIAVTVHGPKGRGTAIWRVSPPPTPPHNVADLSGFVTASSFAATLRGGGHAPPRERLQIATRRRRTKALGASVPRAKESEHCALLAVHTRKAAISDPMGRFI